MRELTVFKRCNGCCLAWCVECPSRHAVAVDARPARSPGAHVARVVVARARLPARHAEAVADAHLRQRWRWQQRHCCCRSSSSGCQCQCTSCWSERWTGSAATVLAAGWPACRFGGVCCFVQPVIMASLWQLQRHCACHSCGCIRIDLLSLMATRTARRGRTYSNTSCCWPRSDEQALASANATGLAPPVFRGNWMEAAHARMRWFEIDGTPRQMRPLTWWATRRF